MVEPRALRLSKVPSLAQGSRPLGCGTLASPWPDSLAQALSASLSSRTRQRLREDVAHVFLFALNQMI